MKITEEDLAGFKATYERVYGEILTDSQAYDMASRLLRLGEILLEPLDDAPDQNQSL